MKKTLSILLSLIMIVTMLPTFAITALADESNYNIGLSTPTDLTWVYNYTDKTVTISGKHNSVMRNYEATFSPLGEEVSIMEDNKLVRGLVETANITCTQNVGNYFFSDCPNLKTVNFDEDCILIGVGAFGNCTKLDNVTFGNSITTIGESAFHFCSSLTSVTLPNSLETIGNYAFKDTGMKSIVVPASVTEIGENAFYGIDTVYYTGSATGAPWGANKVVDLSWSIDGTTLNVSGSGAMGDWNHSTNPAPWYDEKNGVTNVVIGEGITTVGAEAFYNFTKATSVTLPSTVTSINNAAFKNNYLLSSVTLPEELAKIGNEAFYSCKLTSINLPTSLDEIGSEAFGATKISEFNVPCTVSVIGSNAFASESRDSTVYYSGMAVDTEENCWGADEVVANPGHYTAATCTAPAGCSICNVTYGAPLGHSFGDNLPACAVCGTTNLGYVPPVESKPADTTPVVTPTPTPAPAPADTTPAPAPVETIPTVKVIQFGSEKLTPNAAGEYVSKKAKKPALSKVTAGKKSFTATWKSVKGVTGYQVQYATDSKFKKGKKSVTVKKAKTVKTTVKKLSAKKKYYVRIRTYKTVNGVKIYSGWSKVKTVTIKK